MCGCADQPAQTLGSSMVSPGKAAVSIASGGTVVTPLRPENAAQIPTDPRLHVFNHAARACGTCWARSCPPGCRCAGCAA
ncbi:MAG: hypothetical protein U0521_21375 [Anaerolineae bacterium]